LRPYEKARKIIKFLEIVHTLFQRIGIMLRIYKAVVNHVLRIIEDLVDGNASISLIQQRRYIELGKMEENSTVFGNASIVWNIDEDSEQSHLIYKQMRNFLRLLDQVQTYDDLYKVLKLLRPSDKYEVVSVKLDSTNILLRLFIFEQDGADLEF
jgi:hypothetical protein